MKTLFFLTAFVTSSVYASILQMDQYPEDRLYTASDRGMSPYRASSIYKTGTFSLTFDDGPHPTQTAQILDILKKHNIKATFFVLTSLLNQSYVPLIKRMLDEGHIVGNHGPSHDRVADLTKEQFKAQVKESFLTLAKYFKLAGHPFKEHYFRFPYGNYGTRTDYHHINALKEVSQELMGDNCINMVFWDVDTADWVPGMTPQEVSSNIIAHNEGGTFVDFKMVNGKYVKYSYELKNPPAGGVILQHDVQAPSVKGTDLFLTYAAERGLKILRLNEIEEFKITKNCSL